MEKGDTCPRGVRRAIAAAAALTAAVLAHSAGLIPGAWAETAIGGGGQAAVATLGAWTAARRARTLEAGSQRNAWLWLALSLALQAVAGVLWLAVYGSADLSPADIPYLASYATSYLTLVCLVRARATRPTATLALDGAAGGLTVAAIGAAFLMPMLLDAGHASALSAAVNLAYPLADLVTLAFVVVMFTLVGWRPGPAWLLLGGAFATQALGDVVYLGAVTGSAGDLVSRIDDAMWTIGFLALAIAPWARPPSRGAGVHGWTTVVMPAGLFLAALATVMLGSVVTLPIEAVALAGAAMLVSAGRALLTFRELTDLTEARRQARTDELTGLINRRAFFQALNQRIAAAPELPAAVLVLDLDRFKELNDTMGHRTGDLLLEQIGRRVAGALRPTDSLARLGGDEFAVLCPGAGAEGGLAVARRLQDALAEPFPLDGILVHADASIGIAVYPRHGAVAEDLLQRADVAMYQAKSEGTASEIYDAERDDHSRERLQLLGELRRALDAGEQMVLHYQPQVSMTSGRLVAVEALVRWEHPERGLLPPGAFVGAAESGGLMRKLTRYVLRAAVAQVADWRREGHTFKVAVNLSASDLVDTTLAREVGALLEEHGVPGEALGLELTETDVMTHPERAVQTMHELRSLGCTLALDDFGTGYSSLSVLKRLPVDELKIDRSFVMSLDTDADDAAIVRAATGLARDLHLSVVAEGVETDEAWSRLAAFGCTTAQGYLISRPLAPDALRTWLDDRGSQPLAA